MRGLIRGFFRLLRVVLGPWMLLWEKQSAPKGLVRTAEAQQAVDAACAQLTLYQFRTCPFCIKVRQEERRLSLHIRHLDAQFDPEHRQALSAGGGTVKVPCLKISAPGAADQWLYESSKIIDYLRGRFAT